MTKEEIEREFPLHTDEPEENEESLRAVRVR